MYERIANDLGMTKRQLLAEFKKRHAYLMEDELKVVEDIKAGRYVDYTSVVTESMDAVGWHDEVLQ